MFTVTTITRVRKQGGAHVRLALVDQVKRHTLFVGTACAPDAVEVFLKVGCAAAAGDANALLVLDGKVVVDNDVAPINVDALGQNVRRNEKVLLALFTLSRQERRQCTHAGRNDVIVLTLERTWLLRLRCSCGCGGVDGCVDGGDCCQTHRSKMYSYFYQYVDPLPLSQIPVAFGYVRRVQTSAFLQLQYVAVELVVLVGHRWSVRGGGRGGVGSKQRTRVKTISSVHSP